jgi:hypothetical protein
MRRRGNRLINFGRLPRRRMASIVRVNTMIPRSHNPASIILAVQFLAIIVGTLVTTGMLKVHGYPDAENMIWSPTAVFIRNWGWVALIFPVLWYAVFLYSTRNREDCELSIIQLLGLIILTIGILVFYVWIAMTAAIYSNKAYLFNR